MDDLKNEHILAQWLGNEILLSNFSNFVLLHWKEGDRLRWSPAEAGPLSFGHLPLKRETINPHNFKSIIEIRKYIAITWT